jgi:hypothetical protein
MNETLKNIAKEILKDLLSKCTEGQQMLFKKMYSHKNLELPINDVVDNIEESKIDHAISQCSRTVEKNGYTAFVSVDTAFRTKKECPQKINGSCPLHNIHCAYPKCEE